MAMTQTLTVQPDRRTYIGSSDAAPILGVSPWRTPFQVWQAKTSPVVPDEEESKVMKRGKRLEPVVLQMLRDEMPGLRILKRNARFTDPTIPYLSAEIDAVGRLRGKAGEIVNVEVKTVHPSKASQWGEEGTDDIPLWYAAQISHALMITERRVCIVAALIGADDLRVYRVERDDDLIATIRAAEISFWENYVAPIVPPPLTTLADVNLMYQRNSDRVAVATDGIVESCANLYAMKRSAKQLDAMIEAETMSIKAAMRDAAILVDANGRRLATWKLESRDVFDQRRFTEEQPKLAAEYRKTTEARVFRVSKTEES